MRRKRARGSALRSFSVLRWAQIEAGEGNPTLTTLVKIAVALGDLFAPVRR